MKTKISTFLFFILFSGFVFGQGNKMVDPLEIKRIDSLVQSIENDESLKRDAPPKKFLKKVHSLKSVNLNIKPIKPTDTISIENENGVIEKYKLKYIDRTGNAPSFKEIELREPLRYSGKTHYDVSYFCKKRGTDFIVITMDRLTGMPNYIHYYYKIIK